MLNPLNKIEYLKICFKHALQFPFVEVVEDGVLSLREYFLLRSCGSKIISVTLPLFISEVSWMLTHSLN